MSDQQVRVTFEPHGRAVFVLHGTKILEAAARGGLTLDTPCGGQGTCGKCRVRMRGKLCAPEPVELERLSEAELAEGWRLACQSDICGECVIEVPESSLFASQHRILEEARTAEADEVLPAVRKVHVRLAEPSLADDAPDLLRLQNELGAVQVSLEVLRQLGRRLREGHFAGTAVLADHHLIDFEPGDTTDECVGAAFDVGTTTVVGSLVDLREGHELAVESAMNAQVRFGDDVLSRIKHGSGSAGLEELRSAIVETVSEILDRLCARAGAARERVYEVTFAGNTTMQHLLSGIDPAQLGHVPFVPAFGRSVIAPAAELGLAAHPRAAAVIFPVIGGFVGGDAVAGMLATRLVETPGPALMVDIGTNGEIVLAHDGQVWAASTAAGPAFEGARISCGMRATAGAIEKVVFDGDVRVSVIGGAEPIGLCGSALVDLTAELLRSGLVTPVGRMLSPDALPEALPEALRGRVVPGDGGQPAFVLAEARGDSPGVTLTQRDVRELQLAAGAIRAGITLLLKQAELSVGDLQRVLIAGGFGSFIRRSNAQRIGLLPPGVDHRKILYVGNASLAGAKWALVSTKARRRAEEIARLARHVELSQDPDFQTEFAEAMIFPGK
jgi:uncharacterized 2Fe-2S/4Fe-4S cluster protein (DUF4445 family)